MSTPPQLPSKLVIGLLVCFHIVPWSAFCIVGCDVLPSRWQFDNWPVFLQRLSVFGFAIYVITEFLVVFGNRKPDSKDKTGNTQK